MSARSWTVEFEGQRITVTNHIRWFPPKTWETLSVDDTVHVRNDGSLFRMAETLYARVRSSRGPGLLEARIGQLAGRFRMGCHIFVDGELIGGDVDGKLFYPDPKQWESLEKQGLAKFLLLRGILAMGVPYALAMVVFTRRPGTLAENAVAFVFYALFFGTFMGLGLWWLTKSQYAKRVRALADLEQPSPGHSAETGEPPSNGVF